MSKFWKLEIEESKQFRRLKGSREEGMSAVEKPLESQPPAQGLGRYRCLRSGGGEEGRCGRKPEY